MESASDVKCKGQSCTVLHCCREARRQAEQWTHALCCASLLPLYL